MLQTTNAAYQTLYYPSALSSKRSGLTKGVERRPQPSLMVDGAASFRAVDGGSDNSACGGATAAAVVGIAGTGVVLGRSMLVLCWLVGWVGGRGGGGGSLSAMVDGCFVENNTCEAWQNA